MVPVKSANVALISPFFFPEMISTGRYNTHLAKALQDQGCSMRIIASHPLYPDWKPKITIETVEGMEIMRGGEDIGYPKPAIIRRIVLEIWFAWYSSLQVRRIRRNLDVVVVVFPPVLFTLAISAFLSKKTKKIGIVHDLLGVMATSSQGTFRWLVANAMRWLEIKAFSRCDKLICLSESMKKEIVESYGIDSHKCAVHYPFVSLIQQPAASTSLSHIFRPEFKHIVYSGALGEKQKPVELMQFFEALCKDQPNIVCHVFSRGPVFEELSRELVRGSGSRVLFHDLVPENSLLELYNYSDVQVIPQAEGTGAGAFPSKLPNLLAAGVPIFAICDAESELASVVDESGIGSVVHSWKPKECVEEISKLLARVAEESHDQRRQRLVPYVKNNFSVDELARAIMDEGLGVRAIE